MKKLLMPLMAAMLVVASGAFAGKLKEISADELNAKITKGETVVVVDSRGGKYFDGEMIQGAVNIPADQTTAESLAKVAPQKDATVVFYCTNPDCSASATSAAKAEELGYTNVYKYKGGIEEWKEKGLPTSKSNS